eukprot:10810083-Heterocapsa_arctica.AAC.1
MHRHAPHSRLAVASALARLNFSNEAMDVQHGYHPEDLHQVGGPSAHGSAEVPDPIEPNGSSADLTDGFY